jgi:RNA polymerase sigma-70 factor (ECF subfamily)
VGNGCVAAIVAERSDLDEERDLVERARHDRAAFAQLYRRYYDDVTSYVYRRLGDVHATEDVVAEVFLAVMQSLRRYQYRGIPLKAWLYRIATNSVNRWLRRNRRYVLGNPATAQDGSEAVFVSRERADVASAREAMLALSPKHQTVLSLHYFEGLSVEEVASVIGCRVGTVKSRLSRGRESLQRELLRRRS